MLNYYYAISLLLDVQLSSLLCSYVMVFFTCISWHRAEFVLSSFSCCSISPKPRPKKRKTALFLGAPPPTTLLKDPVWSWAASPLRDRRKKRYRAGRKVCGWTVRVERDTRSRSPRSFTAIRPAGLKSPSWRSDLPSSNPRLRACLTDILSRVKNYISRWQETEPIYKPNQRLSYYR